MEKKLVIRDGRNADDIVLKSGEKYAFSFNMEDYCPNGRYSLYFTGESRFSPVWRDELDFQHFYGMIDDSLSAEEAEGARYCLDFSMKGGENYVKRAVKKIVWKPSLFDVVNLLDGESNTWDCGIYAKARRLRKENDGFLRLRFEIRYVREGIDNRFTDNAPDKVETIDIPEGSYDYQRFRIPLILPEETVANVMVYLEGGGYSGDVYFERPHFVSETGYNILPDFSTAVQNRPFFDWYGCNLSKREWPFFRLTVNGRSAYEGEVFEAMHRYPSFELDIPSDLLSDGENKIEIEYRGEYREPAPFAIRDIKVLCRPGGVLSVIGHGENAILGGEFSILVRTGKDGVRADVECDDGEIDCLTDLYFEKAGLHVIKVCPRIPKNNLSFGIICEGERTEIVIPRVVRKDDDRVITGTGDAVYINFDSPEYFEKYLEWYTENNIGQLLTLRPIYRWGGTRTLDETAWRQSARLLGEMGYCYSMMTDGRDIPGYDKHPTPDMLDGRGFLGYQLHERDGQFFYWSYRDGKPAQNFQILDEFYDICMRMYRESPVTMSSVYKPCNVKMKNKKYSLRMDTDNGCDAERLADGIAAQLSDIRDHFTRHTGPAMNFRSFFKAGYKWLGAETMYASTELQMAFLRGASRAFGAESMGVHAAVQWSNRPHDCESRKRLYRLALYVPYICGATEINTEEGLLRLEAGYAAYDRFSSVCLDHLEQQRDFNRYVTSHTRRGDLYSPVALIYGRDDTWTGYHKSANAVSGCLGMQWGEVSRSWELLNLFYPRSCVGSSRAYSIRADENTYMYTETPFGNIDVVPIETDDLRRYRLISFAGYNRAVSGDMNKLADYLYGGGKVIIGWPHLSETSDLKAVTEGRMTFADNTIISLLGGVPELVADSIDGRKINIAADLSDYDEVLARSDSGSPLVVTKKVGDGELIFVNALEYPGNQAVSALYKALLKKYTEDAVSGEHAWIESRSNVEFSAYDCQNGARYFYVLSVDHLSEKEKMATLRIGSCRYEITVPFGRLLKIAVVGERALWSDTEDTEFTVLEDGNVRVAGAGEAVINEAKQGKVYQTKHNFDNDSEIII